MIYDISLSLGKDTVAWPGDPGVQITARASMANGDESNVCELGMSTHSGTHIDAPAHFIKGGKGADALDLEVCIGRAEVVQVTERTVITRSALEPLIPEGCRRLLLKTPNSSLYQQAEPIFQRDFVALDRSAASLLVERGIELLGIDYLSVESFAAEEGNPVHKLLLGGNVIILEGINLNNIAPGPYDLVALPLKLVGTDGAPCRAILRDPVD